MLRSSYPMSVAFETNSGGGGDRNRIQPPGFSHGMWIYNLSESGRFTGGSPWSSTLPVVKEEDSSSSSSIGKNSDALSGGGDSDEDDGEVQSKDNGSLNGLNSLEEVLPIRRGISTFYAGKSKSYGSLADASSVPSIQDIVKPEDAYSRKRKNMLAHNALLDKHRKSTTENGISKRLANSSSSCLDIGLNINGHDNKETGESSDSNSSHSGFSLPPLPSRQLPTDESSDSSRRLYCSPWRSLSLSDLQHVSAVTSSITGLVSNKRDNEEEH
ncbi:uncharacterized protein LOC112507987 [Cynara cardunculus var. scolymus]|uniref:Uncharacterized protein n=1 Tax=Cynara cardunculus var. scolymus TaxID=59895 RepID=A0A103YN85_CYNCS|nr:uncharacterized protein LOC112507987 [Cynara cardunculus var. scolymus]KVI12207.1 hypothetical protein Ccrd_009364 [Cynara cardunculus var. scolymus]